MYNFIQEFLGLSINAPMGVQDYLAAETSRVYREVYKATVNPTGEGYEDYLSGPEGPAFRQLVRSHTLAEHGFVPIKRLTLPKTVPAQTRAIFQNGLDIINAALTPGATIGQLENVVARTLVPGLSRIMAGEARSGRFPLEAMGTAYLGVVESVATYNPLMKGAYKAHFLNYGIREGLSAAREEGRYFGRNLGGFTALSDVTENMEIHPLDSLIAQVDPKIAWEQRRLRAISNLPQQNPINFWTNKQGGISPVRTSAYRQQLVLTPQDIRTIYSYGAEDYPGASSYVINELSKRVRQYIGSWANMPEYGYGVSPEEADIEGWVQGGSIRSMPWTNTYPALFPQTSGVSLRPHAMARFLEVTDPLLGGKMGPKQRAKILSSINPLQDMGTFPGSTVGETPLRPPQPDFARIYPDYVLQNMYRVGGIRTSGYSIEQVLTGTNPRKMNVSWFANQLYNSEARFMLYPTPERLLETKYDLGGDFGVMYGSAIQGLIYNPTEDIDRRALYRAVSSVAPYLIPQAGRDAPYDYKQPGAISGQLAFEQRMAQGQAQQLGGPMEPTAHFQTWFTDRLLAGVNPRQAWEKYKKQFPNRAPVGSAIYSAGEAAAENAYLDRLGSELNFYERLYTSREGMTPTEARKRALAEIAAERGMTPEQVINKNNWRGLAVGSVPPAAVATPQTFAMNMAYGQFARPGLRAETTFDAILTGERTATTRWGKEADRLARLKAGDEVVFTNTQGERLYVRVTKAPYTVPASVLDDPKALDEWSRLEGWSPQAARQDRFFGRGAGVQIQYELTGINSPNLARLELFQERMGWKDPTPREQDLPPVARATSSTGQIYNEAKAYVSQFGITNVKQAPGTYKGLAYVRTGEGGKTELFLGKKFLDPDYYSTPNAIQNFGADPQNAQQTILAHEVGHRRVGGAQVAQAQRYLNELAKTNPEKSLELQQWLAESDKKTGGQSVLEYELAADIAGYALGKRSPRLASRWGLDPESQIKMAHAAIDEMVKNGKMTQDEANSYHSAIDNQTWNYPDDTGEEIGEPPGAEELDEIDRALGIGRASSDRQENARRVKASLQRNLSMAQGVYASRFPDPNAPMEEKIQYWSDPRARANVQSVFARRNVTWGQMMTPTNAPAYFANPKTGEVSVSAQNIETMRGVAESAWGNAWAQGNLPSGSANIRATITARIDDFVTKHVEGLIKGASEEDRPAMREFGRKMKGMINTMLRQSMEDLEANLSGAGIEYGQYEGQDVLSAARSKGYQLYGLKGIKREMAANPALAKWIDEHGGAEAVARGPRVAFTTDEGTPYLVGGGGRDGGDGGGAFGGRGGIWGSRPGQAMYAMYIAKRLFGMTVAPIMAEAEQYGKYMGELAPAYMALTEGRGPGLTSTDAGYATRLSLTRQYFERTAYQNFGGFNDVLYGMTGGSGALGRLVSSASVAGGAAAIGGMLGPTMGFMLPQIGAAGAAAIGSVAAPIGIGIGAALFGGTALMEIRNAIKPDQEPITWGTTTRDIYASHLRTSAMQEAFGRGVWQERPVAGIGEKGVGTREFIEQKIAETGMSAKEFYRTYLTPEQAAIAQYEGEPEQLKWVRRAGKQIQELTGEEVTTTGPVLRAWARSMGQTEGDFYKVQDFAEVARNAGFTTLEFWNKGATVAEQFGFLEGTPEFREFINERWARKGGGPFGLRAMDAGTARRMEQLGAQVGRYGGMLSPYFAVQPELAAQMVTDYGLLTQARAGAAQSVLSTAGLYGLAGESQIGVGYRQDAQVYQVAGTMANRWGPIGSQAFSQVATTMAPSGASWGDVVRGFNQNWNGNPQNMQSVVALSQLQQYFGFGGGPGAFAAAGPNAFQSGLLTKMAESLMIGGYGTGAINDIFTQVKQKGMSNQDVWMMARMGQGDLSAWSAYSRQTGAPYQFLNEAGNPIYMTNMAEFLRLGSNLAGQGFGQGPGMGGGAAFRGINLPSPQQQQIMNITGNMMGFQTPVEAVTQFFSNKGIGISGQDAAIWASGGAAGRTWAHMSEMAGYQAASAGVQLRQIALQQNYLWGAGGGGSWDSPAAGSLWNLEDRMRRLQHRSTMADFAAQEQRLQLSNTFNIQQEQIGLERMQVSHGFQRWQRGFDWSSMMMQRGWMREDWQYQDQMRGMQFGWQMEDFDEAIRYSSGRQRRQVIKQKERAVTTHDLEEGQIERTRSRQEQVWSREEERFRRQSEYSEKLMELDVEQYNLSKKQREAFFKLDMEQLERHREEYQKQYKLQTKMIELNREYQYESLELSKQAAGIQAAAAAETKDYAEQMKAVTEEYDKQAGEWAEIYKNDPTAILKALKEMGIELNNVPEPKMNSFSDMVRAAGSLDTSGPNSLINLVYWMNHLNIAAVQELIRLIQAIK